MLRIKHGGRATSPLRSPNCKNSELTTSIKVAFTSWRIEVLKSLNKERKKKLKKNWKEKSEDLRDRVLGEDE